MLCCDCLVHGYIHCNHAEGIAINNSCCKTERGMTLICGDNQIASSLLMISLLNYLRRNPVDHIILLKPKQQVDTFRILFLDEESTTDTCLKRVHIKYVSTYHEINQFIVAASASYQFSFIAIDNWNMFYECDGTEHRDRTLLKQCRCSICVVDNGLVLSRIRQMENVVRSWFDDVFVVRKKSGSEYSLTNLFGNDQNGGRMESSFNADHLITFR